MRHVLEGEVAGDRLADLASRESPGSWSSAIISEANQTLLPRARARTAASCRRGRGPAEQAPSASPRSRTRTCRAAARPAARRAPRRGGRAPRCRMRCVNVCPRADQLRPQLLEVVDLAVHHHGDRPILVEDRLVARREVDDREPPHAERRRPRSHQMPRESGPRCSIAAHIRSTTSVDGPAKSILPAMPHT